MRLDRILIFNTRRFLAYLNVHYIGHSLEIWNSDMIWKFDDWSCSKIPIYSSPQLITGPQFFSEKMHNRLSQIDVNLTRIFRAPRFFESIFFPWGREYRGLAAIYSYASHVNEWNKKSYQENQHRTYNITEISNFKNHIRQSFFGWSSIIEINCQYQKLYSNIV